MFKSETKSKLSRANNYHLHDKAILYVAKNPCISHPFYKQIRIISTRKFLVQKNIFSKVRGNGEANTSLDLLSLNYVYSFLELKSECRKWDTFKNWPLMKIPQYLFCCHKTWWKFPPYGAFDVLNEYPLAQCAEMILNKIEKTFNKTYIGLKSFLQRSQIFFLKILDVRAWNPPARQQCRISPIQAVLPRWLILCPYG